MDTQCENCGKPLSASNVWGRENEHLCLDCFEACVARVCAQCGAIEGEEYGDPYDPYVVKLSDFHGDHICQDCLEAERQEAEYNAQHGIITIWLQDETP